MKHDQLFQESQQKGVMLMLGQVRIDIGLQTYREMMNVAGGATNKGKIAARE